MHKYNHKTTSYVNGKVVENYSNQSDSKRLVFIDCGARKGENFHWDGKTPQGGIFSQTLEICKDRGLPFLQPSFMGAEIHMFEPNEHLWVKERHETAQKTSYAASSVHVHECAVWTKNEMKDFFISIDQWGDCGSSLCSDKREILDRANPKLVPCIDFCEFIVSNFSVDDDVVVKFDVEGAEYDILESIVENVECMKRIDSLFIEWHGHFFPQKHEKVFKHFLNSIKEFSINHKIHYAPWSPGW